MATYFGEIIEPDSRSFVTDGEECFLEQNYVVETRPKNEDNNCEKEILHEYFVIASGKVLSDFSSGYLITPSSRVIESYIIVPTQEDSISKEKVVATLYLLSKNTLLCVCENLPHVYFAHKLFHKLKPWIQTTNHLVVLTSDSMSNFKPSGAMYPFLRSLKTNACSLSAQAQNLELPNTILGLPATIISWCQANKKSALMYVMYAESSILDSFIAQPLLQLVKSCEFLNPLILTNTAKLNSIVNNAQLQYSNLYL